VLAWRLSNSMATSFCLEALEEALARHGKLIAEDIERLWRSLKHENVYLMGYADGREARTGIGKWITFYNEERPHQALDYRMPMALWRGGQIAKTGAAGCGHVDNARALPERPTAAAAERCYGILKEGAQRERQKPTKNPDQVVPLMGSTSNANRLRRAEQGIESRGKYANNPAYFASAAPRIWS
jgi:hypothetical protein